MNINNYIAEINKKYNLTDREVVDPEPEIRIVKTVDEVIAKMFKVDKEIVMLKHQIKGTEDEIKDVSRDIERWQIRQKTVLQRYESVDKMEQDMHFVINTIRTDAKKQRANSIALNEKLQSTMGSFTKTVKKKAEMETGIPLVDAVTESMKTFGVSEKLIDLKAKVEEIKNPQPPPMPIPEPKKEIPKKPEKDKVAIKEVAKT